MNNGADFMPIPKELFTSLSEEERFIAAYPRSGSRWLRMLLIDVFCQEYSIPASKLYEGRLRRELCLPGADAHLATSFSSIIGTVHNRNQPESILPRYGLPPVWRTHHVAKLLDRPWTRFLVSIRDPSAMLLSYDSFAAKTGHVSTANRSGFLRWSLATWEEHTRSLLDLANRESERILILEYGLGAPDPFNFPQLAAAAAFLGFPEKPSLIDCAMIRLRTFLEELNQHPAVPHHRGANPIPDHPLADTFGKEIEESLHRLRPLFEEAKSFSRLRERSYASETHSFPREV